MNFNLKNYIEVKSWKTFSLNYYDFCKYSLSYYLKNFIFDIFIKDFKIYFLVEAICFKKTNLINNIDNTQKVNLKFFVFLPILIEKEIFRKVVYYLIAEIPVFTFNKDLIINGLKKVFVSKIVSNFLGIFIDSFIKGFNIVVYTKIKLRKYCDKVYVILNDEGCFFSFSNKKYDLFFLLKLLNIFNKSIFKYFCFKKYNLKKIVLQSNISSYNIDIVYFLKNFFNFFFIPNIYYIFLQIYKKNLEFFNFFLNISKIIIIDFMFLVNLLINIKNNKIKISHLNFVDSYSVYTLGDFFISHFSIFINKRSNQIEKDICYNIVKNFNKLKKVCKIFLKSNNYFFLGKYITINPLIQYLEQTNSVSEISHKSRLINYSSFKNKQNLSIRDINLNQIGSICLINTSEGINCGLTGNFTKLSKINNNNKIKFPYTYLVPNKSKNWIKYIDSFSLKIFNVCFNINYYLRKNKLLSSSYLCLSKETFKIKNIIFNNNICIHPNNLFSYVENLIPFLFFNDPTRSLMGAKMQTQATPLLNYKKSYVLTGSEKSFSNLNTIVLKSYQEGIVIYVSNLKIIIKDKYNRKIKYFLNKYKHSNNLTIIHQKPLVWPGEKIFCGQILVNSQDIINSEFNVGNNLIISYGNFFGYNFEDAVVINKKVIYSQLFTSLHFSIYEIYFNKLFPELPTKHTPKRSFFSKRNLDFFGIIKEGSKILQNDILISKIIIKPINILFGLSLFNLISFLFGKNIRNIKDTSILVPLNKSGRVIKTEIFTISNLNCNKNETCYLKCVLYICNQRILTVGDKLCGLYGNKGVVAYICNGKDLPYSNTGVIPDIITDSISIPSRLNIGQLIESLLSFGCFFLNKRVCITNKFNKIKLYIKMFIYTYLKKIKEKTGTTWIYNSYSPGQIFLRDGRTGYKFIESSFLGISRYYKLIHMIKDKIHYRTIGPYTELTQQATKGKKKIGGQRFGEMEIWSLEAYGVSYNLREILNYKSDDLFARTKLFSKKLNCISIPESFRLLLREIHSMCINIEAFSSIDQVDGKKIEININF